MAPRSPPPRRSSDRRHRGPETTPSPDPRPPGPLGRALVGIGVLAFYAFLAAGSLLALSVLWRLRIDPVAAAVGLGVGTLLAAYVSLRLGTRRVLSRLDARELSEARAPALYELLDDLSATMSVDRPRLLVGRLGTPNAFALDTPGRGTVVVDASLFRLLDADEMGALLAHELAHLERRDGLVGTAALGISQLVVVALELLLSPLVFLLTGAALGSAWVRGAPQSWPRTVPGRVRRRVESGIGLVAVATTLFLRAHARRREFAADERAAEVTGRPLALANALRTLDRAARPSFGSLAPLWHGEIESEEERRLREYFSTHPPTEDRIERLHDLAEDSGTRIPIA